MKSADNLPDFPLPFRSMIMRTFLFNICIVILCLIQTVQAEVPRKKFVELGWDIPSTQFLRENYREMQENTPFSGVIYKLQPADWGASSEAMCSSAPWKREDFQVCIDDLKACEFTTFTDNFIRVNFTPGTVAWNDDAGWKIFAQKVAIAAWVARETGSKGLAPDFESYGTAMFHWNPDMGLTFSEATALARRRGFEFITAVASEQPDAVILALWLNSINRGAGLNTNPDSILSTSGYGLLPAFINGMLDAAPAEMVFIDGCENGYYIEGSAYTVHALDMISWTGPCMALVEPELRQKYRSQVQSGFGFYLDMYTNPEGNTYYRGPKENGTRFERLCDNLSAALNAADQYVWVYGEKNRWWDIPKTQNPEKPCIHWETALPGLTDTMRLMTDPVAALQQTAKRCEDGKHGANLFENPAFSDAKGGVSAGWHFWQDEKNPTGKPLTETLEDGKIALGFSHVMNGCVLQSVPAKPGERYFIQTQVRVWDDVCAKIGVGWQDEKGWIRWDLFQTFSISPSETSSEWKTIQGIVKVPEGASKISIQLSVTNQKEDTDTCYFRTPQLFKISE